MLLLVGRAVLLRPRVPKEDHEPYGGQDLANDHPGEHRQPIEL